MIDANLEITYTQVLTILKKLNIDDYNKIPKKYIDFLEENCDTSFNFIYDDSKNLSEQDISEDAKSILFGLFEKFGTTDKQKKNLKIFKINYYHKLEQEKRKKYFQNAFEKNTTNSTSANQHIEKNTDHVKDTAIIEYKKDNFIIKIFKKFRWLLKKKS